MWNKLCLLSVCRFTWARAFTDMVKEIHDLAGQHEVIAENLQSVVSKDLQTLISELKQERKKVSSSCMHTASYHTPPLLCTLKYTVQHWAGLGGTHFFYSKVFSFSTSLLQVINVFPCRYLEQWVKFWKYCRLRLYGGTGMWGRINEWPPHFQDCFSPID